MSAVAATLIALVAWLSFIVRNLRSIQTRLDERIKIVENRLVSLGLANAAVAAPEEPAGTPTGLLLGLPAPAFVLETLSGRAVSLASLLASGRQVLLIFLDVGCPSCDGVLAEVSRRHDRHTEISFAVITSKAAKRNASPGIDPDNLLLQNSREVANEYQVTRMPQ
jgi:hypothetical protein